MSTQQCTHEGNAPNAKFCKHCGFALNQMISAVESGSGRSTTPLFSSVARLDSSENELGINKCGFCGTVPKKANAKFCAGCGAKMILPNAESETPRVSTPLMKPVEATVAFSATVKPSEPALPRVPNGNVLLPTMPAVQLVELSTPTRVHSTLNAMPQHVPIVVGEGFTPRMLQSKNISELSGWRVGAVLGKGSFGTVYLGMLRNGTIVAVKQIHIVGEEFEPLAREIGTMRCLSHPNISRFLGCEYNDGAINIFMEFVSGGSLADLIKKFKPLPLEVVSSYTRQILTALQYIHAHHIIHRDIKADNILVETSTVMSREAVIKLVDFGTSRHLGGTVEKCKTFVGTPYWMAPEVLTSAEGYTFKADIWSVGCTVVEMLTGKAPWPIKSNMHQAVYMIGSGLVQMEIPKDVPPDLQDFMDKCFDRNPESRPDAAALLQHPFLRPMEKT